MNVDEKMMVTARIVKKMKTILCAGSVENGNSACGYTVYLYKMSQPRFSHGVSSNVKFHRMILIVII